MQPPKSLLDDPKYSDLAKHLHEGFCQVIREKMPEAFRLPETPPKNRESRMPAEQVEIAETKGEAESASTEALTPKQIRDVKMAASKKKLGELLKNVEAGVDPTVAKNVTHGPRPDAQPHHIVEKQAVSPPKTQESRTLLAVAMASVATALAATYAKYGVRKFSEFAGKVRERNVEEWPLLQEHLAGAWQKAMDQVPLTPIPASEMLPHLTTTGTSFEPEKGPARREDLLVKGESVPGIALDRTDYVYAGKDREGQHVFWVYETDAEKSANEVAEERHAAFEARADLRISDEELNKRIARHGKTYAYDFVIDPRSEDGRAWLNEAVALPSSPATPTVQCVWREGGPKTDSAPDWRAWWDFAAKGNLGVQGQSNIALVLALPNGNFAIVSTYKTRSRNGSPFVADWENFQTQGVGKGMPLEQVRERGALIKGWVTVAPAYRGSTSLKQVLTGVEFEKLRAKAMELSAKLAPQARVGSGNTAGEGDRPVQG